MNRTRSNNNANAVNSSASSSTSTTAMQFFDTRITPQSQQSQALAGFTSTAKLPIETVKRLIAAVSRRPNLWIRQNCGKRYDITQLWQEVGEETQLPADVCRIKWGHLRDNFRKVFIRNTLSDETPTTWRFYNDMRFMEKSVAENIMRQNRYKEQTRYWPEIQQQQQQTHSAPATPPPHLLHPMVSICTLKPNVKMDSQSMQSFGIYTETDEMELPNSKRIKTEPADNYLNGHAQHHADKINKNHNNNIQNNYNNNNINYPQIDEAEHEPDDDDFDEDTATEENEHPPHHSTMHHQMSSTNNNNNNNHSKSKTNENDQMYSMEVFNVDDDDDDENTASSCQQNGNKPILLKGRTLFNGKTEAFSSSSLDEQTQQSYLPNTHIKKTESIANEEQDADRMFLLSLLPYLRNIEGNRKLFVRQKLQNVLIEELS